MLLLTGCQTATNQKQLINGPEHQWLYDNWNFSEAVKVGNQIWLSGQVGYDSNTKSYPDSLEEQTELVFKNIERILKQAGATMEDIVEITSYHTDISKIGTVTQVKKRFIPKDFPAWTAVEITGLARPKIQIEIKVVAVIGAGKAHL
ncbi:MAG: RidA family protein [Gammaproteobacteria bacterium]|nr:RidA family protein [Gammaproteobacteria bacterium]